MARFLILATIILSIISFVSAQVVDTLNTPSGPVTQNATVQVTWTILPAANSTAASKVGTLTAQDMNTKNTITISSSVSLSPPSFNWNVNVPPGTYTLGLNDGSGIKQSGTVQVVAAGGAAPAPPPAGSPSTPNSPSATSSPSTPSSSSTSSSYPASSSSPSRSPSTPSIGASDSSSTSPSGSSPASTHSSAGSIFSYDVVFSLLGVAVAMIQL